MLVRTTTVSENLDFMHKAWLNRKDWQSNLELCNIAMDMLNQFDTMTYNKYWLTDEEEAFFDEFCTFVEICC
mgnify:CR=1 FL=1